MIPARKRRESAPQETLTPVTVTIAKIEYVTVDGDTWYTFSERISRSTRHSSAKGQTNRSCVTMWGTPCRFP